MAVRRVVALLTKENSGWADNALFVYCITCAQDTSKHDVAAFLGAVGSLWEGGCNIDWCAAATRAPPIEMCLHTRATLDDEMHGPGFVVDSRKLTGKQHKGEMQDRQEDA
eukprot:5904824-Amphidinium_carterae.1